MEVKFLLDPLYLSNNDEYLAQRGPGVNQPVHWFLRGKDLGINNEQVYGLVRPNPE